MEKNAKEKKARPQQNGDQPGPELLVPPGGLSLEELQMVYAAAEIKVRALTEQLIERDRVLVSGNELLAAVMEELGVKEVDKIVPAIQRLKKNRQQARSEKRKPAARAPRGAAG